MTLDTEIEGMLSECLQAYLLTGSPLSLQPISQTLESPLLKTSLHEWAGPCARKHDGQKWLLEINFKILADPSLPTPHLSGHSQTL